MIQRRDSSSLLELEATNYFRLNPNQVHLLGRRQSKASADGRHSSSSSLVGGLTEAAPNQGDQQTMSARRATKKQPSVARYPQEINSNNNSSRFNPRHKTLHQNPSKLNTRPGDGHNAAVLRKDKTGRSPNAMMQNETPVLANTNYLAGSSTTSTNSLPSISSSPSVSPSLVCPHLSIDDILKSRNGSKSPHTIGLCSKCRLDPPPNIHSPLSPVYRPSTFKKLTRSNTSLDLRGKSHGTKQSPLSSGHSTPAMKRGYSDQQSIHNKAGRLRDDSLDYFLGPRDLRHLQMSPTLRHSVEYIRNNSIESGRVLKIYKNGKPFDKPLRICITRGEFGNLNNLLDYINTRQLIPSGARYLFHMDGQLVYSVQELKHGSAYVVSGTRTFDTKANQMLKEQHLREIRSRQQSEQRRLNTSHPSGSQLSLTDEPSQRLLAPSRNTQPSQEAEIRKPERSKPKQVSKKRTQVPVKSETRNINQSLQQRTRQITASESKPTRGPQIKEDAGKSSLIHSRSTADLTRDDIEEEPREELFEEVPAKIIRAKSEMSAIPTKRKKNVTFMDTGRGSSPAINNQQVKRTQARPQLGEAKKSDESVDTSELPQVAPVDATSAVGLHKQSETSDIGIQVSDSIDGFLIDLPIKLPGDAETGERDTKRTAASSRANQRTTTASRGRSGAARGGKVATTARPKAKIITIAERQLSLEEMDQLRDLGHGDHHSEAQKAQHVTIKLDGVDATTDTRADEDASIRAEEEAAEREIVPDRKGTINIGQDPGLMEGLTRGTKDVDLDEEGADSDGLKWQYPGGRESSTTPIERPVSQSDASDSVRARVTTPTPSLSTVGDSNSLSMSYDAIGPLDGADLRRGEQAELPPKSTIPVVGRLCKGVDSPERNFELVWVNGFTINDQYPENSSAVQMRSPIADAGQSGAERTLLSPSYSQQVAHSHFKLSDRFHNWICHSRKHDELLYPVGTLVVLWCRWTEEQRFYSRHSANVCAITLASVDADLAASAQSGERSSSCIHLWSLTTLQTLLVIDDDLFRNRRVFSVRAKSKMADGCELSVAAKDDKRLWLYLFDLKMSQSDAKLTTPRKSSTVSVRSTSTTTPVAAKSSNQLQAVIKENKPLAANQTPLVLIPVPGELEFSPAKSKSPTRHKEGQRDLLLCFGRRHFQLLLPDRKSLRLKQLLPENKAGYFSELMVKATSLIRMAPREFLLADSEGNVALMSLVLLRRPDASKLPPGSSDVGKYSVRLLHLLGPIATSATEPQPAHLEPPKLHAAVTCLSRVSGNIFASADSTCAIKFWKIERNQQQQDHNKPANSEFSSVTCRQISCICLPKDLGYICTIVLSRYQRKQSIVEFYVVSTSNAILFGSVQLQLNPNEPANSREILANSSLSVVYEGHECPVTNLVADFAQPPPRRQSKATDEPRPALNNYFTCSLDCKICKWDGKRLIWKSMLPSACSSLAVHPTGFVLAIGSVDGTVYILDKVSGLLISYFPLTPVRINCLAYTRDGVLLAAGCANGSIFILPVYERGLKYKKVSIFQSPHPVMSLQFSLDNRHILTSVTHDHYQELILWDLPNFRYMRDNVKLAADKIDWFDSICSGSEDVRAIWENANLAPDHASPAMPAQTGARLSSKRASMELTPATVVNLSCHRLIRDRGSDKSKENFAIASDTRGYLRLFQYPCYDIEQGFYEAHVSSSAMNCCRFIGSASGASETPVMFASSALDGLIALWKLR